MNRILLSVIVLLFCAKSYSQTIDSVKAVSYYDTDSMAVDTSDNILTFKEFLSLVVTNHPIAKQAQIISDQGKASLRASRGGFDPEIYGSWDKKDFAGKKYYEYYDVGLAVPTWFGLEFVTGISKNDGDAYYYNPERTAPDNGTGYLGVAVPIGQGMIMDERRKALRKAQFMQQASEFDRIAAMNELIYNASYQYWEWVKAYNTKAIYDSTVTNANSRYDAIKNIFLQGEAAAIDTTEALTQVQSVEYLYLDAKVEENNMRLLLSNYIWDTDNVPLEIQGEVRPQSVGFLNDVDLASTEDILSKHDSIVENHPAVKAYELKIQGLQVEKSYYANKLLPKGKLKYNLLTKGYNTQYSTEDYKVGFQVSFPLLLRQARGDLANIKLKVLDTQYKLDYKRLELRNKLLSYNAKINTIKQQIDLYRQANFNYSRLLYSEEIKMLNGESSLFKVNYREAKLYNAQTKLISLYCKFYQTQATLIYTAALGY